MITVGNYINQIFELLLNKGVFLAIAESCTGGMLSAIMVDQPGISDVFWGGITCYSNDSKVKLLNVSQVLLDTEGAVSEACARAMAAGIRHKSGVELGVAITGIAGPSGGSPEKPVGTIYIAINGRYFDLVKHYIFTGDRMAVRRQTVETAQKLLIEILQTYVPVANEPELRG